MKTHENNQNKKNKKIYSAMQYPHQFTDFGTFLRFLPSPLTFKDQKCNWAMTNRGRTFFVIN